MTTAYLRLLDALTAHGAKVNANGNSIAKAQCPAHEDRSPSLSVTGIEGQVLVYCHAGCQIDAVLAVLGLTTGDLFDNPRDTTYKYESGLTVHRSHDKKFWQTGTEFARELYHLSKLCKGVEAGQTVYVPEGEKDVHTLESLGLVATCSPGGAGKWGKVDPAPLYSAAKVVAIADNDKPGLAHAAGVYASLIKHTNVEVVTAKVGKDAADHIAAGYGPDDFEPIEIAPGTGNAAVTLTPATDIPLRAPKWLWDTAPPGSSGRDSEGRIPVGALTIGAGRAGIGKSQHAVWVTAQITRGTLPGCHYGTPHAVIYAASEDSWGMTIAPRLVAAGADLTRVFRIDVEDDGDPHARLTLPTDTRLLEKAIRDNDVALIVMDPLLSLIAAEVNDYRAREVREALEPLFPIADRTGVALFGIAHFTKATGSDPLHLISGSSAFGQIIRAALGYARDDEADSYVLSTIKSNLGREDLNSMAYTIEPVPVATLDGEAWVSRLVFGG